MTSTEIRLLGRCSSCEYAAHTEPPQAQAVERYRDMAAPGVPYRMGTQYFVRCPQNHKPFKLYRIEGEFSEKFQCDSRCEMAKGRHCKCSCGGINHGKGWAIGNGDLHVENIGAAITASHVQEEEAQVEGEPTPGEVRRGTGEDLLSAEGQTLYAEGKVTFVKDLDNSTMYLFRAVEGDTGKEGTVKWFAPSYANPEFEKGQIIKFRAKVKRHEDNEFGKTTVVTYLEEMVPALPEEE